jgi:hypothetical protein
MYFRLVMGRPSTSEKPSILVSSGIKIGISLNTARNVIKQQFRLRLLPDQVRNH